MKKKKHQNPIQVEVLCIFSSCCDRSLYITKANKLCHLKSVVWKVNNNYYGWERKKLFSISMADASVKYMHRAHNDLSFDEIFISIENMYSANRQYLLLPFYSRSPRLIYCSFRPYHSCGFRPPRSFRSRSAVNTIGKDVVLPHAHAQVVLSGTVVPYQLSMVCAKNWLRYLGLFIYLMFYWVEWMMSSVLSFAYFTYFSNLKIISLEPIQIFRDC